MSFVCEACKDVALFPKKLVVTTREKEYPERTYNTRKGLLKDHGGVGWEIVKEINVCSACHAEGSAKQTELVAAEVEVEPPKHWAGTLGDKLDE